MGNRTPVEEVWPVGGLVAGMLVNKRLNSITPGMHDLRSKPGYPKGPYFYVDEDVYEEIVRLAREH